MTTPTRGGCWPTREQEHLLRAALLSGPPALAAWQAWRADADPARVDAASARLFPLLHRLLEREGVDDPFRMECKRAYQHTWAQNHLRVRDLQQVLPAFRDAGIDTVLLKGLALLVEFYRDYGLRPMDDLDLLVRTDDAPRAVTILRNLGWIPHQTLTAKRLRTVHSMGFQDPEGRQLDLHWHLLPETCAPGADDAFWAAARPCREPALATAVLHPMDQLFQVCVHGVRWNRFPPFRWVADATILLRSAPGPEWDRLVRAAERHRLVPLIRKALAYVRALLDAPVPAAVLAALDRLSVSARDRAEQWFRERPAPRPILGNIPEFWFGWRRLAPDLGWPARVAGFPRYMQDRLECAGYGDLASGLLARWGRAARRPVRRRRRG